MSAYEALKNTLRRDRKTWLVTGVAGFIGSNILEALLKLDQGVIGLDNLSTGYKVNLEDVERTVDSTQWKRFTFIKGDVRHLTDCHQACTGVDYILHQAALGSVGRSIHDPIASHQSNVDGFLNMLVAARDAGVRSFVYASSSSVYGDHPALPKVEANIGKPLSPYSLTKYINELYADVFKQTYGFNTIGLRYFNVFGPRQNPLGDYAAVIPQWITAMINDQSVFINGDGQTSRDFCYIDNAVQCNLLAAMITDSAAWNQIYNVAVGDRTTLNDLYDMMRDLIVQDCAHRNACKPIYREFRQGDVAHSKADLTKTRQLLGYQPTHTVSQGLNETVQWYNLQKNLIPH